MRTLGMSRSDDRTLVQLGLALLACATLIGVQGCVHVDRTSLRWRLTQQRPKPPPYTVVESAEAQIGPEGGAVVLGRAQVHVPAGALRRKIGVSVQRLDGKSVPPLPPGLMNVTEGAAAFRFLPENQTFRTDVTVALPLAQTQSPEQWRALGVRTYYWDTKSWTWQALEPQTSAAEAAPQAKTRHFTVMINAILKAPEHTGPENLNENAISSLGAGDPAANVDLIAAPTPNNQGSASVTFPLRLPQGRGAYSPQLALTYSSDVGNGALGVGWDLASPRISVDTSGGAPRYDDSTSFALNGVRLIAVAATAGASCSRIRNPLRPPTLVREYALRVHADQRIMLCRGEQGDYWEVTERDGVRYTYGADEDHRIQSREAIAKVAVWLLQEVEDTNGNLTRYGYSHDQFVDSSFAAAQVKPVEAYLQSIEYTAHLAADAAGALVEDVPPAYRAELLWACNARSDRTMSAKFGFLTQTRCRLDAVAVLARAGNQAFADPADNTCYQRSDWTTFKAVRCYRLGYRPSQFDGKTLLDRVAVHGADGSEFYHHAFDYTAPEYADLASQTAAPGFSQQEEWRLAGVGEPLTQPRRPLGYSNEENHQADLGGGYSFDGCYVGGSTGFSLELPKSETQLVDISGDGVLDRIWTSDNQLRVAVGARAATGGSHGVGNGETRSRVAGIAPEIEHQGAYGLSQSGSVSCALGALSANAGMSVSLRLSYSSSFLIDADGDGYADLLSDDVYYRGLPRTCRDGSTPATGVCADGLEICISPGNDTLCFSSLARSLAQRRSMLGEEDARLAQLDRLARGDFVRVADASAESAAAAATPPVAESTWGPYTSARRRMQKEGPAAATFEALRPIVRWDAAHEGVVNVRGVFTLRNGADADGVKVGIYLVADPNDMAGSKLLKEYRLNERKRFADFSFPVPVKFRWQIHFLFDPLAVTPVTETGLLLDLVDTQFTITYTGVCPLDDACRALTDAELAHRGPTGQLAYVYAYPQDFRRSELPREDYWNLMPPLGPDVTAAGAVFRNQIEVSANKLAPTATPVHVRVRCESVGSQRAGDDHVCPLGTILKEAVFDKDAVGQQRLDVPLPQPFLQGKPIAPIQDCWGIHREALSIRNTGDHWGWQVGSGNRAVFSFETQREAHEFRQLLQHYDNNCTVGPRPAPQNTVHGILFNRVDNTRAERTFESIRFDADCVDYTPFSTRVEALGGGKWLVRSGPVRLMVLSSAAEAEKARSVARNFLGHCFVGRGNSRTGTSYGHRHRDFVYEYFDAPIQDVFDPYRIMVEVDGEDGVEAPPEAVQAAATAQIVSVSRLRQVNFIQPTALLYKDAAPVHQLAPENVARTTVRPLLRVHPLRQLRSFRADAKKWGETLRIHATLVLPKHPMRLSITGDGFEGKLWEATIAPGDVPAGGVAVSRFYEVNVPSGGPYYIRAYTEASFDPLTTAHVKAYFEDCASTPPTTPCLRQSVPVNVLQADFGLIRRLGTPAVPVMGSHVLDATLGEVAHSFDPFAGGHHGFFYGVHKGNTPPKCFGAYGCGQHDPWPTPVAASAADENVDHAQVATKAGFASLFRTVAADTTSAGSAANELCWIKVMLGGQTLYYKDVDSDGDGVCDGKEPAACMLLPEDRRGPQPDDGCPAPDASDADGDGAPDISDVCPYQPADSGGDSRDGCPILDDAAADPLIYAANPVDDGAGGEWNCQAAFGLNSFMCGDGGVHPGHDNSSGGGTGFGGGLGDGMRRTWTLGLNQSVGATAAIVSANASIGISAQYTDRDVLDWNGDGIVDLVSPNVIDLGGSERAVRLNLDCYVAKPFAPNECLIHPGVRESVSVSVGLGASLGNNALLVLKTKSNGKVKDQNGVAKSTGGNSFSFGGSLGINFSLNHAATVSQRIDVNGDGLPDQIFGDDLTGDLKVRLNQGERLSDAMQFTIPAELARGSDNVVQEMTDAAVGATDRAAIGRADTFTRGVPWSVGGGVTIYGFGGSANYSETDSKSLTLTTWQFSDVNADGLVDILVRAADAATLQVSFNMGDHFGPPRTFAPPAWRQPLDAQPYRAGPMSDVFGSFPARPDPLAISDSDTFSWAASTSGSFFGFTASSSYSNTRGKSRDFLVLRDMDADGVPDRVLRTRETGAGGVWVSRGLFGRANLLKTIDRPFGGRIALGYALSPSSEDQPRAKWVLADIVIEDSAAAPQALRAPAMTTRVSYERPYYDRYERADLGFAKLTVARIGQEAGQPAPVVQRVVEQSFYNRDFWLRGVLRSEKVLTASNSLLEETITEYASAPWPGLSPADSARCRTSLILPQRYLDSAPLRSTYESPCDVRAPRLSQTIRNQYDGGAAALAYRQEILEYDAHGNAKRIRETYDGAHQPVSLTLIEYDQRAALRNRHILDRVSRISVRKDSELGELLRMRQAEYDDRGNQLSHATWADAAGDTIARLVLTRDALGYLTKVADASGLETTFTPEPVTRSLTAGTQDNRGLSSTSRFDLRFQAQLDSTDANGQVLTRAYDQYGRLTRVRSPYEAAADLDSIAITYPPSLHSNLPAYASTRNVSVDPSSGELVAMLSTAQFADGHGRILQTQVQAEVDGVVVRIVSPPRSYDYAGRIVCEGHPTFVANLDFGLEAGGCGAQTPYTHTIYDALDRVVQVTTQGDDDITGELVTRHAYAIGVYPGDASRPVRQMTVTDPEGKISRLYYDAAERLVAMGRQLDTRELVTRYEHSAVADLLKVIDARNTQRAFEYDLAGRTVAVTTPNTGRSEYAYDVMGNLIQQTDSELCNATPPLLTNPACANKIVKRQYVRNRLSLIDFPAAADVTLVYGDDDPGNRCAGLGNTRGRLCWTQDEAGTERTSYGALGEKLLSERTIDVAGDPAGARTYATSFLRDSFGRLLRVIYPDGEVVTYGYDAGARLNSAVGERNNVRIGYVMDRRYDVYGKALATDYGNGVTETNEYFANTQRLHRRLVHSGSLLLSGLELRLDRIGNVRRSATERADGHEIADVVRAYSYDDLHRLDTFTLAADGDSAGLEISGDYDYDDAGNITRQRLTHSGDGESFTRDWAYTYNLPAPDLPDAAGPAGFTYDGRGATKTYTAPPEAWTYHWNEGGQLAGVDAGSQSRYLYDSRNTRIWRSVVSTTASGETVTQTTHYPGPFYIASWKRVRPAGCTTGSCEAEIAERTKHVRADARNVASTIGVVDPGAGPVEQSIAYLWSAQHYIHADQVNSTFAMTDSTGLGQEVFEYLPYGEVVSGDLESLKHLSGFDGMELDLDSGLHFFGGRYYRAALGRWLSADPLSLAIQEKQDERLPADSLYAFAMDNPVSLHDPDGLAPGPTADIAMNYMRTNTGLYWFPMRKGKFHTRPGEQKYFESLPTHRFSNFGGEGMKKARGTTNCSTAILEALWQTFAGREEALGLQTKGFSKRFQGKQWVEALEDAKMGYRIDPNDVEPGDIASTEGHRFFIAEVIGDQARVLEANVVKGKGWKTTPAVSEWRLIPLSIIKAAARLIDFD